MERYIGTKIIHAERAMHVSAIPPQDGYKVLYGDGYTSWSPAAAFEEAYRRCDAATFGLALEALKKGKKVARAGWNGKGMWLMLVPEELADKVAFQYAALSALPWIGMKTAEEKFVPWLASQTDMLAEDWLIFG